MKYRSSSFRKVQTPFLITIFLMHGLSNYSDLGVVRWDYGYQVEDSSCFLTGQSGEIVCKMKRRTLSLDIRSLLVRALLERWPKQFLYSGKCKLHSIISIAETRTNPCLNRKANRLQRVSSYDILRTSLIFRVVLGVYRSIEEIMEHYHVITCTRNE